MIKPNAPDQERQEAKVDDAMAMSRLASASAKLMTDQATVFAAMTAYSIAAATQWAGLFMGAVAAQPAKNDEPSETTKDVRSDNVVAMVPRTTQKPVTAEKVEVVAKSPLKPVSRAAKPTGNAAEAKLARSRVSGDDLKRISGIGPRIVTALKAKGIVRFKDLVALDATALAALDEDLGLEGRIVRDDWVGQAKSFMKGKR